MALSPDQWDFLQQDPPLYEEEGPSEAFQSGGLKLDNPDNDPTQRAYVHVSPDKSAFRKTLGLVVCAHGKLGLTANDHASLIIISAHFACDERKSRFKSIDMRFRFTSCTEEGVTPPEVLSWGPYNTQQRSEKTEQEVRTSTNLEATFGVQQMASADFTAGIAWEVAFKRLRFRRAQSDPLYNARRGVETGVKWWFEENGAQEDGAEPDFHLFMLVKPARNKEGDALPFQMSLEKLRCEAGFWTDLQDGIRRFFWPKKDEDKPVLLDPTRALHIRHTGERVESVVKAALNNLQTFKGDGMLPLVAKINSAVERK